MLTVLHCEIPVNDGPVTCEHCGGEVCEIDGDLICLDCPLPIELAQVG